MRMKGTFAHKTRPQNRTKIEIKKRQHKSIVTAPTDLGELGPSPLCVYNIYNTMQYSRKTEFSEPVHPQWLMENRT